MVTNYNQKKRCHNLQRKKNQPIVDIKKIKLCYLLDYIHNQALICKRRLRVRLSYSTFN